MSEHTIEYTAKCTACKATGVYVGMGERDGAAVVCSRCKGTGRIDHTITYEDFDGLQTREGVQWVYEVNPGVVVGSGKGYCFQDFGGMPYSEWQETKNFPEKSEMRKYTCPAWWFQCADYRKGPKWKECTIGGCFSDCSRFPRKKDCWDRWDREN